nr:transmembrane protein [Ipomoea batatas]
MASATPLPDEQQVVASSTSQDWHSSGSIRPFFAVISVLTLLAILSCILGRICRNRRRQLSSSTPPPLDCVKQKGCHGWMRRWWLLDGGNEVVPGAGDKAPAQDEEGSIPVPNITIGQFLVRFDEDFVVFPDDPNDDDFHGADMRCRLLITMSQPGEPNVLRFHLRIRIGHIILVIDVQEKREGVPIPKSQDLRRGSVDPPATSSLEAETGLQHRRSGAKEEDDDESPAALLWRAPYSPFPTGFSISGREQSDMPRRKKTGMDGRID